LKCGKDFTTLSERDKFRKFAFTHFILDKMICPYCHASNCHLLPTKIKRGRNKGLSRGYAGWNADRPQPNIILHQDCRSRLSGSMDTGYEVVCEGCPCVFNCWTGNVDDGEHIPPIGKTPETKKEEAVVKVAVKKRDEQLEQLQNLREKMGKVGLSYETKNGFGYCRLGGTIWKLLTEDLASVRDNSWATAKTSVIKRSLDNKKIDTKYLRYLVCKLS